MARRKRPVRKPTLGRAAPQQFKYGDAVWFDLQGAQLRGGRPAEGHQRSDRASKTGAVVIETRPGPHVWTYGVRYMSASGRLKETYGIHSCWLSAMSPIECLTYSAEICTLVEAGDGLK